MLKQAKVFRENQSVETRVMDSNDLERERGITILSKASQALGHNSRAAACCPRAAQPTTATAALPSRRPALEHAALCVVTRFRL